MATSVYGIRAPRRPATCAEYGCPRYFQGFSVTVPEGPQAELARSLKYRDPPYHFTETRDDLGRCVFTFPPGQECFAEHLMPWDGRERFTERDQRTSPQDARLLRPDDWVDSFANNQIKVAEIRERG